MLTSQLLKFNGAMCDIIPSVKHPYLFTSMLEEEVRRGMTQVKRLCLMRGSTSDFSVMLTAELSKTNMDIIQRAAILISGFVLDLIIPVMVGSNFSFTNKL